MEDWCREYIERENLTNIELAGRVPHEEVLERMTQAWALVLPTQVYEGFPMTVIEAFSRGTPVIGTDLGNTGSLVKDGANGLLFAPNSVQSLAEALMKCLQTDMERMGRNAYHDYVNLYSEEENYRMLAGIYSSVLARP